jgi:hypothetical protein
LSAVAITLASEKHHAISLRTIPIQQLSRITSNLKKKAPRDENIIKGKAKSKIR